MKIKINIRLEINRVIKYLILADLALLAGWGLIEPILSVYVVEKIPGATLVTVGIAAAIYWILKSVLQIPIANFLDGHPGEKDDFYALVAGLLIGSAAAFSFALIGNVWELYLVQAIHAVAFGLYVPSWSSIFSRHLDKDRVSFDWSLDSTMVGLSAGVSGFLGAAIANLWGFRAVFVLASLFSLTSVFVLLLAPQLIFPKRTGPKIVVKDHLPTDIMK